MATWEDGPEYAPHEPPTFFTAPETEPLSVAPPRTLLSSGAPAHAPQNFAAPQVPPLELVGTGPGAMDRNPRQPFAVAAAAMTEGTSAWGAAHSMRNAEPAPEQWAAPQGAPTVATGASAVSGGGRDPMRPIRVGNAAASTALAEAPGAGAPGGASGVAGGALSSPGGAAGFPPGQGPGSPGGPGLGAAPAPNMGTALGSGVGNAPGGWAPPVGSPAADPNLPAWRKVTDLLTWPLIGSLALGLIPPISPIMLLVSLVLSFRLEPRAVAIRNGIIAGVGYTVFIALLSLLSSSWWSTTTTWAWLVNAFVCVYAGTLGHLITTGRIGRSRPQ